MAGSTISSTITHQVTLGYGVTLSPLTITNAGDIDYAGGYAILVASAYDGTIVNNGSIIGKTDGIYTVGYAVTVFNNGTIHGGKAGLYLDSGVGGPNLVVNSAAISGNFGIEGTDVDVTNNGVVAAVDFGIHLSSSTIMNSGTVTGQTGVSSQQSVLANTGAIVGTQYGLYLAGGTAINSGTISGAVGVLIANVDAGGSLSNEGSISGGVIVAGGALDNAARISGITGVSLGVGGNATNSGHIYGQSYGVVISGPANAGHESFVNTGSIYSPNQGVRISGAYFKNSGSIGGGNIGVSVAGELFINDGSISSSNLAASVSGGSFVNSGTLTGGIGGISITSATVTNFESISGGMDGAVLTGGSLANYGKISGTTYGVADFGGGITNFGMISGASYGILMSSGMVMNAGTITGSKDAIYGSFITLGVEPGAVFSGNVVNKNGPGVLDLAGAGVGNLSGIGTQIKGFGTIGFSGGADWLIAGSVAGLTNGVAITGMGAPDTIVVDGFAAVSDSFVSGTGLEISNGSATVTLDIEGSFSNGLQVTLSGENTVITDVTCFAAGTGIATPGGKVAVERLQIGDLVRTLHAGDQPVKWVGWRQYDGATIDGNLAALPVCIRQNAIADGVPEKDLWVSPGHAIAIDNVLVHAARLVNGVSVVQAPQVDSVTYYHVELQNHEVVFAENCPAESFQDEHFRQQFGNAADFKLRYPTAVAPTVPCLPRLDSGFQLHAIERRVAARAGIGEPAETGALRGYLDRCGPAGCFGWAQDLGAPDVPVSLDILSGGRPIGRVLANLYRADVRAAGYGSGYQGFEFLVPAKFAGKIEVRRTSDAATLELAGTAVQHAG